jgi:hypothetical protein
MYLGSHPSAGNCRGRRNPEIVRSRFSQVNRTTEYNHVEQLARSRDQVEEELLEDGSVLAKAPDVWGEVQRIGLSK